MFKTMKFEGEMIMQNIAKNETQFPVDKSEQNSLNELTKKLEALGKLKGSTQHLETITDDFEVDADRMKIIEKSEAEMRELLGLLGVNYDDLIRMDDKSVYARAVKANPNILDYVKNAENPVLAAVKVSLQFKPYAEFMEKYGQEPSEIFKNIKHEIEGKKKQPHKTMPAVEEIIEGASFSEMPTAHKAKNKSSEPLGLAEIFNQ